MNQIQVMGLCQFLAAQFGSGQQSMVWVWVWKISPKNVNFFNFLLFASKNLFGLGQKVPWSKAGRPLIYCGSKVCSGLFRAYLYQILNIAFAFKR